MIKYSLTHLGNKTHFWKFINTVSIIYDEKAIVCETKL